MSETETGISNREDAWFIMGAVSTGFFVWMGLWDAVGLFNAMMLGFGAIFFTYTLACAPRTLRTNNTETNKR